MTSLTQLFVFIEFQYTFNCQVLISKITEQRQNFANSDRYTNEDTEINNSNRSLAKVLHSSAWDGRCSKGVLRGGSVRGTSVRRGARLLIQR